MTCIVGIASGGRMLLMGDSAATDKSFAIDIVTDPKVVRIKGRLLGFSGDWTTLRLMRKLRFSDAAQDPRDEMESVTDDLKKFSGEIGAEKFEPCMLLGIGGRLFTIQDDWSWYEPAPIWRRKKHRKRESLQVYAIGSGSKYALGALAAQADIELTMLQRAEEALRISAQYCAAVRAPFIHVQG